MTGAISSGTSGWTIEDALDRVRHEFLEMPGLHLTLAQAQRLWHLDGLICESVLGALTDTGFLARTTDGAFVRSTGTL